VEIDGNDPPVGCVLVRAEEQRGSLVPDGPVLSIVDRHQRPDRGVNLRRVGTAEIGVVQAVLVFGTLEHRDEQIAAVLGHIAVDHPAREIVPLVDEPVLRLGRPDPVVVESMS
jgi:hypothetical protein